MAYIALPYRLDSPIFLSIVISIIVDESDSLYALKEFLLFFEILDEMQFHWRQFIAFFLATSADILPLCVIHCKTFDKVFAKH